MSRIFSVLSTIIFVFCGCRPQPTALELGIRYEIEGREDEAIAKFAEAAAAGCSEAYYRIAKVVIQKDENAPADDVGTIEKWLVTRKRNIEKATEFLAKANSMGFTNDFENVAQRIKSSADAHAIAVKDVKEKKDEIARRERELQLRREEETRREIEAAQKHAEELRRHRIAEEKERLRREEELARRSSPEYCIANQLVLSPKAFIEVVRAVNAHQDTGNEIADDIENRRQHSRFIGERIKVEGRIVKVETTLFTDKVKCIVDAHGRTISARFDEMSKRDGAALGVGERVLIEGKVSNRPVLSDLAMDGCVIKDD